MWDWYRPMIKNAITERKRKNNEKQEIINEWGNVLFYINTKGNSNRKKREIKES